MKSTEGVGANDGEGPPVPIPNTVVKLTGAENTWRGTAWEDRKAPTQRTRFGLHGDADHNRFPHSSLAQPVEHAAVNRRVVGSSPTGGAISRRCSKIAAAFFKKSLGCYGTWAISSVG